MIHFPFRDEPSHLTILDDFNLLNNLFTVASEIHILYKSMLDIYE